MSFLDIITLADKHDLIAQLGEHYLDRVGVAGSNPAEITIIQSRNSLPRKEFFIFFLTLTKARIVPLTSTALRTANREPNTLTLRVKEYKVVLLGIVFSCHLC